MSEEPGFPILRGYRAEEDIAACRKAGMILLPIAVPWAMIAPHERQARDNHGGQSLRELAARGGLSACDAVAVLENRDWRKMTVQDANRRLCDWLCYRMLARNADGFWPTCRPST